MEDRLAKAKAAREQAQAALDRVADQTPEDQFQEGERVWLEAKNLALPYQTRKLAPKRHGPFVITKRVSPVAYQLGLPPTWTIHDVFHASLLTRYKETTEHGTNFHQLPPKMVDGEDVTVRAIPTAPRGRTLVPVLPAGEPGRVSCGLFL